MLGVNRSGNEGVPAFTTCSELLGIAKQERGLARGSQTCESLSMTDLSGKVVLITGGNGGIGLGMAEGCAAAGADIVIWGTNPDKLKAASEKLLAMPAAPKVLAQQVDVGDEESIVTAMADAAKEMGRIDSVMANAGIAGGGPFIEETLEGWRRIMSINLEGVFLTLREGAKQMIAQGEGGSLVAVSSVSAIHGAPGAQAYASSKAGVLALIRGLAVELARYDIRANSVVPGWTETEMTGAGRRNDRFLDNTTKRTPIRRWGTPEDFRTVGAFLADPSQAYHTGDEIIMDGGYTRF